MPEERRAASFWTSNLLPFLNKINIYFYFKLRTLRFLDCVCLSRSVSLPCAFLCLPRYWGRSPSSCKTDLYLARADDRPNYKTLESFSVDKQVRHVGVTAGHRPSVLPHHRVHDDDDHHHHHRGGDVDHRVREPELLLLLAQPRDRRPPRVPGKVSGVRKANELTVLILQNMISLKKAVPRLVRRVRVRRELRKQLCPQGRQVRLRENPDVKTHMLTQNRGE